jgi:predicted negative regulator of RcsB-dependent stress response|tara:strand:+ start:296 stop:940 length:645 start_codon:yes stop_codon:yes gene_type:complete
MDEETAIINTNTRNEKIKNFFINNKKNFIIVISIVLISLIGFFTYVEIKKRNKIKIANQFNSVIIEFNRTPKEKTINALTNIINEKDNSYSPLALYFIIDNNLLDSRDSINELFDVLINKTNLEKEIKNLIIYKKALYNSDFVEENILIQILNPIINSQSIWKSHGLYLMAEYYYSKNEKQKAKEFFNQILILPNGNKEIKLESKKRINRDLSE